MQAPVTPAATAKRDAVQPSPQQSPEAVPHVVDRDATSPKRATSLRQFLACLLVIGAIGGAARFLNLYQPREVIFDEVHFGKFVNAYLLTNARFFDIHPPHAKLVIAAVGYLGGYKGGFDFVNIGESFGVSPAEALRLWPAFAGSMLPVVIFILLLQLGVRVETALCGGLALALDNGLIVQSRAILLDMTLLLATFGALSAYLAARERRGWRSLAFSALCGIATGFAAGTKFTGLATGAMLGMIGLADVVRGRASRPALTALAARVGVAVSAATVVYLAGWIIHFSLLTRAGDGDAFYKPTGQFFEDLIATHKVMLSANYGLGASHPDASPWWSWPLMLRPPFYWSGAGAVILMCGNPTVWWGSTWLFLGTCGVWFANLRKPDPVSRAYLAAAGFAIACFLVTLVPLARVPRVLFMYHYMTPLIFSVIGASLWTDRMLAAPASTKLTFSRAHLAFLALLVFGFAVITPVTYGFAGPKWYMDRVGEMLRTR